MPQSSVFRELCRAVALHPLFEALIILVIILNTVTTALVDENNPSSVSLQLDDMCLYVYTAEAGVKVNVSQIIGWRLIETRDSYLRKGWNVVDLTIVGMGWVVKLSAKGLDLKTLRLLRILRPLKSISSINGMKEIFMVLVNALKPLASAFTIILIFLFIFAIGGVNLWSGLLHFRCMDLETGVLGDDSQICGNANCMREQVCVESGFSPFAGAVSFDDVVKAFIVAFECVTLEGWTDVMVAVEKAFSAWGALYFLPLVFLGSFLFLNLTLAVVQMKFSSTMARFQSAKLAKMSSSPLTFSVDREGDDPLDISTPHHSLQETVFRSEEQESNLIWSGNLHANVNIRKSASSDNMTVHEDPDSDMGVFAPSPSLKSSNFELEEISRDSLESITMKKAETVLSLWDNILQRRFRESKARQDLKIDLTRVQCSELVQDRDLSVTVLQSIVDPISKFRLKYQLNPPENAVFDSAKDVLGEGYTKQERETRGKFQYTIEEVSSLEGKTSFLKFRKLSPKILGEPDDLFFHVVPQAEAVVSSVFRSDAEKKFVLGNWSGESVNPVQTEKREPNEYSLLEVRLWSAGPRQYVEKMRFSLRKLMDSQTFSLSMIGVVFLNTVVLTIYYQDMEQRIRNTLDALNLAFTIVLVAEVVMRIVALGPKSFIRDVLNLLDSAIASVSLLEVAFLSQLATSSAFKALTVLRSLRVLKVIRLFRYLQSMSRIAEVLARASIRSMYLALLLVLFIIIFALIGRQLFQGEMVATADSRASFDSFFHAFLTVFQVLTLDNWNSILRKAMTTSIGQYSFLYFYIWIFLGNFVLLNLFLAILLDAFSTIDKENEGENEGLKERQRVKSSIPRSHRNSELAELMAHVERRHSDSFEEVQDQLRRKTTIEDPWMGIKAMYSCYVFSKENPIRKAIRNLTQSSRFETGVLFLIFLNCCDLVWETTIITQDSSSPDSQLAKSFDITFTVIFALEAVLRSVSQGFLFSPGSYLRDSWNFVDFLIVLVSIIELNFTSVNLSYVKVFRALRTLRALRVISHNVSMKLVVRALLQSILAIINAVLVLQIVWIVFAILGVSLFAGKFRNCEGVGMDSQKECEYYGYRWDNSSFNFDNSLQAMMTLFVIGTGDNWTDFMYLGIDARSSDLSPQLDSHPEAAVFFIVYIFVTSFFLMNVFIGLLIDRFQQVKRDEGAWSGIFLDARQQKWIKLQSLIPKTKADYEHHMPSDRIRKFCNYLANSRKFELAMMVCIVLNMASLSCPYYGMSNEYAAALERVNAVFTGVFTFEAVVKILGLGCKGYFSQRWNCFDFFVVLASLFEVGLSSLLTTDAQLLRIGPQITRVARVLRVSRLFRLARSLSDLQSLLQAIIYALPSVLNVFWLLLLIYFVYAVLGVFLFYDLEYRTYIYEYANFQSFPRALLLVIRMSTGESWSYIMLECAASSPWAAYLYFFSFIIFTNFLILNLFIMVIVQSVEDHYENPESYMDLYTRTLDLVQVAWRRHRASEYSMHYSELLEFLYDLGPPLGEDGRKPKVELAKEMISLGIPMDRQGFIFFQELLFCLYRRAFGTFQLNPKKDKLLLYLINKEEAKTVREIGVQKRKVQLLRVETRSRLQRGEWFLSANPYIALLYRRKVFTKWREYWLRHKQERFLNRPNTQGLRDLPSLKTLNIKVMKTAF